MTGFLLTAKQKLMLCINKRLYCTDCGARLPEMTLYDLYRSRHRCCPGCGVAVTEVAVYCPECGARLPERREAAV